MPKPQDSPNQVRIVYFCDPDRAVTCNKSNCIYNPDAISWDCDQTFTAGHALFDAAGRPMINWQATLDLIKNDILLEIPSSVPYKYTAVIEENAFLAKMALTLSLVQLGIFLFLILS